jgi:hypothetical protein
MRSNPKDLNGLQLRTLAIFQALAPFGTPDDEGGIVIEEFPHAHGDHVHVGNASMRTSDASGLGNEAVWVALARKGLIVNNYPLSLTLTKEGQDYPVGQLTIFHGHAHHH